MQLPHVVKWQTTIHSVFWNFSSGSMYVSMIHIFSKCEQGMHSSPFANTGMAGGQ
jgi:hypothetical protein